MLTGRRDPTSGAMGSLGSPASHVHVANSRKPLFTLFVIACASAFWYGAWRNVPPSEPLPEFQEIKGLAVKLRDLDLGTVWEDDDLHYQLPIENRTSSDIRVVDFIPSCWCLDVKPRSIVVPAWKTKLVDLALDLTHRVPGEIGLAEREFKVEITPVFESGMHHGPGWRLHGISKSRITLDTLSVDFGEAPVRGKTPVQRKVLATVHLPVDRLDVTTDPSVAKVKVERHKTSANTFELAVFWNASLPVGPFKSQAVIDVISPAGERLRGTKLPIAGRMQPEVRLLPSRLILGSKPIGEKLEAVVVIQAPPDVAIKVDHIETDSRDLHIEPVAIEGLPSGRAYKVVQKVRKAGDQSGLAKFFTKSDRPSAPMEMQVCYRGEAPAAGQSNNGGGTR
jgi:hypothetical protein